MYILFKLRGQRVIFVRLNGVLEIVDYKLTEGPVKSVLFIF